MVAAGFCFSRPALKSLLAEEPVRKFMPNQPPGIPDGSSASKDFRAAVRSRTSAATMRASAPLPCGLELPPPRLPPPPPLLGRLGGE